MADLRNNPLLWITLIIGAAYWVVAPLIDSQLLSIIMAVSVMITSGVALCEYSVETWLIIAKRKRSDDARGRGSHLAIMGFFLFAFGSVFAGTYVFVWNLCGQPLDWIGSPAANFGRFCHVAGFVLMQAGPALKKDGFILRPSWGIAFVAAAVLLLIGFYLGLQVKVIQVADGLPPRAGAVVATRPNCHPSEPVIAAYHTVDKHYRDMVVARRCFVSVQAALEAGYRITKQ